MFSMLDKNKGNARRPEAQSLLQIEHLRVRFASRKGRVHAVNDIDLSIRPGEILGLVGESGSGKSVTALSIMGLIRPPGKVVGGQISFNGEALLGKSKKEMQSIRGDRIAMIFQDPATSLNPVLTIGEQIAEVLIYHKGLSRKDALKKAEEMLEVVRIPDPSKRLKEYPHQLSGGMKQRVMIAIALSCHPELLIADEPTTALDVTIQSQILDLLQELRNQYGTSILLITHDIGIVAEMADHVAVMYCGKILSYGDTYSVLTTPAHPYISALLHAIPKLEEDKEILDAIPGNVPNLSELPRGCSFSPRCQYASERCFEKEPEEKKIGTMATRCWLDF
jgi:oligopeptide/dipeptide ABC transporter ATP-binding protein